MKKMWKITRLIVFLITVSIPAVSVSQESGDSTTVPEPTLSLLYESISPDSIRLTASLLLRKEEGMFGLDNAPINFNAMGGTIISLLGTVKTDSSGDAILVVPALKGLPSDKNGITTYTATFPGTSKYKTVLSEIQAKRAFINITFSQEDSIRNIHLKVYQVEGNGQTKPVAKQTVVLYIPRLFSLLKIGEADLDDNGIATVAFSQQFVGDSLGNLKIIAKIEENDLFGNVIATNTVSWGVPKQYYTAEKPTRELWTPVAPRWMIITLIIMLTGVWAHYMYAVVQMIMIKRHSKQKKEYF